VFRSAGLWIFPIEPVEQKDIHRGQEGATFRRFAR
jgi:hypothetical protein